MFENINFSPVCKNKFAITIIKNPSGKEIIKFAKFSKYFFLIYEMGSNKYLSKSPLLISSYT